MKKGANSKYHVLLDGNGFLVKHYSYKISPDPTFINRFSTGDPSLVGQPRVPKWAQTDWSRGEGQEYWEDIQSFNDGNNVDTTTFQSVKLALKFGSTLYTGGVADYTDAVEFDGYLWAANGAAIVYSADGASWAVAYTMAAAVTDIEAYSNKLCVAVATGTDKLWTHDAGAAVGAWSNVASSGNIKYLREWGDNLYLTGTNLFRSWDKTTFTTIKDFSGATSATRYLKKPEQYYNILYVGMNIGSETGRSEVWHYDLENFFRVMKDQNPVNYRMWVYANKLIVPVVSDKFVSFKIWNGKTESLLFDIEQPSSNPYNNEISFTENDLKLYVAIKRSGAGAASYLYVYDTAGWSKGATLTSNVSYHLGTYNKEVYVFTSDGIVKKIGSTYEADGVIDSSIQDHGLLDIEKVLVNVTVNHKPLPANTSVKIYYQDDQDGTWTLIGTNSTTSSTQFSVDMPTGSNTVKYNKLQYRLELLSSDAASTPEVEDVNIGFIFAPTYRRQFEFQVVATANQRLLDGSIEARKPEQILSDLVTSKSSNNILSFTAPDGGTYTVLFSDDSPSQNIPHHDDDSDARGKDQLIFVRLYSVT